MGNGNYIFTIDPTTEDPAEFGEPVVCTEALCNASLGKPSVDDVPYEDDWGRFYSAYTPVFDSAGNVAGIVAVDFSAEWYDRQVFNQMMTIIIITILSLSFAAVILLMITSRSRRRFLGLYSELNNLSDGIEMLANELSEGEKLKGTELLHTESQARGKPYDEVSVISEKIRSLQKYMAVQIDYVRAKAYKDVLTGLENRNAYLEYVDQLNEKIVCGECKGFTVAMFDINGLKDINDREGHDNGDGIILKSADILKRTFGSDRIFRIGGDEFVVIIDHSAADDGHFFDDYERVVLGETAGDQNRVIMSKGFAVFDDSCDRKYRDTFERADRSMYENKKNYYETYGNRRANR